MKENRNSRTIKQGNRILEKRTQKGGKETTV